MFEHEHINFPGVSGIIQEPKVAKYTFQLLHFKGYGPERLRCCSQLG